MIFSKQVLYLAASHCMLAYQKRNIMSVATDTQVWYEEYDDMLWFGFRGSTSLYDWIANFRPGNQEYPYYNQSTALTVRRGFLVNYDSVRREIQTVANNAVLNYPNLKIYITGHSLGGALATICADDLFGYKPNLITIGAPKIGNIAFVERFRTHVENYVEIVNVWDIVTYIPPFNRDLAKCADDEHLLKFNKFFWGLDPIATNHDLKNYINLIESLPDE